MASKAEVQSVWDRLSSIDCSGHTEEKNGFTYLSWAWAWSTLKKLYPRARFSKLGFFDLSDGSQMVSVRVWIETDSGEVIEDVTEVLPVLDYKNKPVVNPDCFSVNSAYQRCLVKCLAYMGLGMYIYQGEATNPDAKHVYEVRSVDGKTEKTEDLAFVAELLIQFMDGRTLDSLRQFWAMNKQPIGHLETLDPDSYKRVFDAFTTKAEDLKEAK